MIKSLVLDTAVLELNDTGDGADIVTVGVIYPWPVLLKLICDILPLELELALAAASRLLVPVIVTTAFDV